MYEVMAWDAPDLSSAASEAPVVAMPSPSHICQDDGRRAEEIIAEVQTDDNLLSPGSSSNMRMLAGEPATSLVPTSMCSPCIEMVFIGSRTTVLETSLWMFGFFIMFLCAMLLGYSWTYSTKYIATMGVLHLNMRFWASGWYMGQVILSLDYPIALPYVPFDWECTC